MACWVKGGFFFNPVLGLSIQCKLEFFTHCVFLKIAHGGVGRHPNCPSPGYAYENQVSEPKQFTQRGWGVPVHLFRWTTTHIYIYNLFSAFILWRQCKIIVLAAGQVISTFPEIILVIYIFSPTLKLCSHTNFINYLHTEVFTKRVQEMPFQLFVCRGIDR